MKIFKTTIAIAILLLMGCSKENDIPSNCVESVLSEWNMTAYNGQEIGCKFYLELYHHQDKQFFLFGSHCADVKSYPMDCEGNTLCENGEDPECRDFIANAERIGIIGVGE